LRALLAFEEIARSITRAIRNLVATIVATTPDFPYVSISGSKDDNICFIQTNVPPHRRVTKNKPIAACLLVGIVPDYCRSYS